MASQAGKRRKDRRPLYITAGFAALLVLAEAWMLVAYTGIAQHPDRPFDWLGLLGVLIGLGLADAFLIVYVWTRAAEG